ncbi:hypothetical protein OHC33_010749 [Knufia fluminis]|uniref:Uncharacterized protein n=1 Tax=Knufia fluminis TaxID=191047 RepID=A0AAN8I3C4_9EURO|nr:hypothetical protein OHC33_010749 [Knufia fluminis]
MAKKRAATNSDSLPCRKKSASSSQLIGSTPHLPQEILNIIMAYSAPLPNQLRHGLGSQDALDESIYHNPWLHVNSACRKETIKRLAYGCIWIEIDEVTNRGNECMRVMLTSMPNLHKSWRTMLPGDHAIISFQYGTRENPDAEGTLSVMYPFNYQSFMYMVSQMKMEIDILGVLEDKHLEVACSTHFPASLASTRDVQIAPLIRSLRCLARCDGIPRSLSKIDSLEPEIDLTEDWRRHRGVWTPSTKSVYQDATFAVQQYDSLIQRGLIEEAEIFSIYFGRALLQHADYYEALDHPDTWTHTDLSGVDWKENAKANMEMKARKHIFTNEIRAHKAYQRLRKQPGWHERYDTLVSTYGEIFGAVDDCPTERWVEEPNFTWFGMSGHDRGCWHNVVGSILLDSAVHAYRQNILANGGLIPFKWSLVGALADLECAMRLAPGKDAFRLEYDRLMRLWNENYTGLPSNHLNENFMVAARIPRNDHVELWFGSQKMLHKWGSENLTYLPRAQRLIYEDAEYQSSDDEG